MNLQPGEEQRLLVDLVRRFVREEIIPLEAELDPDASELEPADHARLAGMVREMGLFGLDIPEEYGGPGVDIVTRTLMAIEMAQHRAGLYAPCYGGIRGGRPRPALRGDRGPEGALPASHPSGREAGVLRSHRALGRERPRPCNPDPGRSRRRRLDHQRLEDLHLGGGPGRLRDRIRPHRPRPGPGRSHLLHRGDRLARVPRAPGRAHPSLRKLRDRAPVRGPPGTGGERARGGGGRVRHRERPPLAPADPVRGGLHRGGKSRRRRWPSSTRACGRPSGRLSQPASRCRT